MQQMKILLLPRYTPVGASSRYRSYIYLPYLRSLGHEVTVAPFATDLYLQRLYDGKPLAVGDLAASYARRAWALVRAGGYDLIWLEAEAFPWMPAWVDELLLGGRIPYVVDYDDAIFHRYDIHRWAIVRVVFGKKIDQVMAKAALVIAGNKYLASRARNAGASHVEIIPTVVDLSRYPAAPVKKAGPFTIGWVGSMSTAKYLKSIHGPLRTVCAGGEARLVVVGAVPPGLEGVSVMAGPWSEEQELEDMKTFDLGVMPLVDSPWERGKCGHKLIKYMAYFLPVVASPVGVNSEIVDHGVNGFLVRTDQEWVDALEALRKDPFLRSRMGAAGRAKAESLYSLQVMARKLAALLATAAARAYRLGDTDR